MIMYNNQSIACIIPARDEAQSIGTVLHGLQQLKDASGNPIIDQIVVCDNGSSDNTAQIARRANVDVVVQPQPGYGRACLTAMEYTRKADIILFMDGDNAFRADQAIPLIDSVARGIDLAIGSRSLGCREPGALTLPQHFGNWLACHLIRFFWKRTVSDLGPFRAISQQALQQLAMEDKTFGWTIEMQIKAIQQNMMVVEHPVDTFCRLGHSKISGTVMGTMGAGVGILSMIAKLRWQQCCSERENERCKALEPEPQSQPKTSCRQYALSAQPCLSPNEGKQ
jgi:glycosyltransferase involved in cell wall biosynthesis